VLVLAFLVGPFDAIVLKRLRARHRSWLTALGWTALATIAGVVAPSVLRSGKTTLTRLVEADIVQHAEGTSDSSTAEQPHASEVWRSGVTAIFAGSSGALPLRPATTGTSAGNVGGGVTDGASWWRGVSPISESRLSFAPFETRQAAISPVSPRANSPLPFRIGQWTFRALMDQSLSPVDGAGALDWMESLRAELSSGNTKYGSRPVVRVRGLPKTCVVEKAALQWPGSLAPEPSREVVWTVLRAEDAVESKEGITNATERSLVSVIIDPPSQIATPVHAADFVSIGLHSENGNRSDFWPGAALSLPGARDRSAAIDAKISSGAFACLYLYLREIPDDLAPPDLNTRLSTDAVIRLVFPVAPVTSVRTTP
jgi:hypothetical protein